MKRIVGLILILCVVLSLVAAASADDPEWKITQQPMCKTAKTGVTITCKVTGKIKGMKYQWIFVNPSDMKETYKGKELAVKFPGIKVSGENKNKMVISKPPEELHGWYTYCHLYSDNYEMDTDIMAIGLFGFEPPEQPSKESFEIEDFTVSVEGKYLFNMDPLGNIDSSEDGVSSLTFTGTGNVALKSDTPFTGWTINGVPYELDKEITCIKVYNLSADTSIQLNLVTETGKSENTDKSKAAEEESEAAEEVEQVDEETSEEDEASKEY